MTAACLDLWPSRVNYWRGTSSEQTAAACWSCSLNSQSTPTYLTNSNKKISKAEMMDHFSHLLFSDLCLYSSPWEISQFNRSETFTHDLQPLIRFVWKGKLLKDRASNLIFHPEHGASGKRCVWFIVPRRSFISTPTPQTLPTPFALEWDDYDWTNPTADGCYQSLTYFFSTP